MIVMYKTLRLINQMSQKVELENYLAVSKRDDNYNILITVLNETKVKI